MKPFDKLYWNCFTLWHARDEQRFPFRPLADVQAVQDRRVRAMVAHAYQTVPYYRDVMEKAGLRPSDFRTAADLTKLPEVSGVELERQPERFISSRYAGGGALRVHSSGTQGRPKAVYWDPAALFLSMANGHRIRIVMSHFVGRTLGYREMSVSSPGSIAFQLRDYYEASSWVPHRMDFRRAALHPAGTLDENLARLNAFRPDVIRGIGSYVGALFRWAWEQDLPVHRPRLVLYGADCMAEADRLLLETQFGVPVLSSYQSTEALHIAYQCEMREGFHVNLDQVALRVVDDYGREVVPGESGHIVVSNLTNRATVLLNYRLGDRVTLQDTTCGCGRSLPVISRIEGRADDLLHLPGGRMMHAVILMGQLQAVPGVVQLQVVQEELDRLLVRAVCCRGTDWETARTRLEAAARSCLGEDVTALFEQAESIPRESSGKVRGVISKLR